MYTSLRRSLRHPHWRMFAVALLACAGLAAFTCADLGRFVAVASLQSDSSYSNTYTIVVTPSQSAYRLGQLANFTVQVLTPYGGPAADMLGVVTISGPNESVGSSLQCDCNLSSNIAASDHVGSLVTAGSTTLTTFFTDSLGVGQFTYSGNAVGTDQICVQICAGTQGAACISVPWVAEVSQLSLNLGWNAVSFWFTPENASTILALHPHTYRFAAESTAPGYVAVSTLQANEGYYVYYGGTAAETSTIFAYTTAPVSPAPRAINLFSNYNFAGPSSLHVTNPTSSNVPVVYIYWMGYYYTIPAGTDLLGGYGYFMYLLNAAPVSL